MLAMEYDELVSRYIGDFGRFQWLVFLLASLEEVSYAFYSLIPVFIANTPPHWCATPVDSFSNCTLEERRQFAIPETCNNVECSFDSCHMYARNYSATSTDDVCPTTNGSASVNLTVLEQRGCEVWSYGAAFYSDTAVVEVT